MRTLLLTQFYPPVIGGEERHVRNLGAALARKGHDVAVATQWHPEAPDYEMDGAVAIHRIRGSMQRLSKLLFVEGERPHAPPFPDPELVLSLKRVVADFKPDVVHAHNWILASFLPLKKWSGAGLVVTLHDYSLLCAKKNLMHDGAVCTGPSLSRCLPCASQHFGPAKAVVTTLGNFATARFSRSKVDRFIAVSHAVARDNGLLGLPHTVIPNFVPDDVNVLSSEIDPCLAQLPTGPFLLFVGDVMHLKGADVLLKAYAGITPTPPPLVVIGRRTPDTPSEIPPNVHLMGTWPHRAIMHAWSRCLFGLVPSVGPEACATVVMEAMACGKPVVASDIGGMPDLVDDSLTGLLVSPGNVSDLRHAMEKLLTNPKMIERMGQACLDRVQQLKATAVVSRIEDVYKSVAHHHA